MEKKVLSQEELQKLKDFQKKFLERVEQYYNML